MARKLDILMFLEYKKNKRLNNIIFRGKKIVECLRNI